MHISLREFQRNATKYLNNLPITLTQYNKEIARVVVCEEEEERATGEELREMIKPLEETKPTEQWGNPNLRCYYCKNSPAIYFTYYDENSDPHEGIFCKKHIEEYQQKHGESQAVFDTVKQFKTDPVAFPGSFPKPQKKQKKL